MKRLVIIIVAMLTLFALCAHARPVQREAAPQLQDSPNPRGEFPSTTTIAALDTTYLLGGPGSWDGSFETPGGQPDWHGWTHRDVSISFVNHWRVSTYMADQIAGKGPGNHAMYCGDETIPACDPPDTIGGYGNDWFEEVEWLQAVADPSQAVTVRLTGSMNHDIEGGYDFLYLIIKRGADDQVLATWDDLGSEALDITTVLSPGEFTGPGNDEVRLAWRFRSDGSYSDTDCMFSSHGACQIDDLSVYLDGNLATFDDFEPGNPVNWDQAVIQGVGDFANLRNDLGEIDPCRDNNSWRVNFVDDGLVVPGTGGTSCIDWCYDPGGWIVNNTGGVFGPADQLNNQILSPPIPWAPGYQGAELAFDVYRHEALKSDSAGIFYYWHVRSTPSADPADLESAPWLDRTYEYNGGPNYVRHKESVSDLLVPDRQWVQVALGVIDNDLVYNRTNGSPAPYFDNVAFKAWDYLGPDILVSASSLLGEAFPENGPLNPNDLASNWCRVDSRKVNIYTPNESRGDSLVVELAPQRPGATVTQPPSLHWVMKTNPVFDAVRPGTPDPQGLLRGIVVGGVVLDGSAVPLENTWSFDLPDTGFFFPGDRIRYYITASDELAGEVHSSVLPPDTTGFLDFDGASTFPLDLEICALPSVTQPAPGQFSSPPMLLYDHLPFSNKLRRFTASMNLDTWVGTLRELGLEQGIDFDIIKTENLDYAASAPDIAPYQTLIYSSRTYQIFEGYNGQDEAAVISSWMDFGGKQVLLSDYSLLPTAGGSGTALIDRLGFEIISNCFPSVRDNESIFQISPVAGNGILPDGAHWLINGSCPTYSGPGSIDAAISGQVMATMDLPGFSVGACASVVATEDLVLGNRSIVLPFYMDQIDDISVSDGKNGAVFSPQANLAYYLLAWLDTGLVSGTEDLPDVRRITVSVHPNPFNPSTTIAFELPRAAEVSLDIYDLQGRLVRRLLDETTHIQGSHKQVWDGRDGAGRATSSGVYFYWFKAGDQKRVGKLTLLK